MAGPLPRKKLYRKIVETLLTEGYFDEWRETSEICYEINSKVPVRWSPVYPSSVFRYMRELPLKEEYLWKGVRKSMIRQWKKN
tara:strand:- start:1534 stop:1782 length:249 start_codon:yes stop_codon:yes gene_type:complete